MALDLTLTEIRWLNPTLEYTPRVSLKSYSVWIAFEQSCLLLFLCRQVLCWRKLCSELISWSWCRRNNHINTGSAQAKMTAMRYVYQLGNIKNQPWCSSISWQTSLSRQQECSVDGNNCLPEWVGKSKGDSCLNLYWVLHYKQTVMKCQQHLRIGCVRSQRSERKNEDNVCFTG